jgi:hypothetical protein
MMDERLWKRMKSILVSLQKDGQTRIINAKREKMNLSAI